LKLLLQLIRRAASRAACTAGNNSPTSTPMIAITTNNSTSVKPDGFVDFFIMQFQIKTKKVALKPKIINHSV
jgi:hypothetical protein